ncbi:hypothetical protein QJS10_CPB22g00529 [Acorus calamus]|uniref:Uncharacterized protein n=1 Tax=Acorus calamus TaxID=4465 RepID=A0AAV9C059_ACOCL|nr:hypothetical protein QJS10_CPB22g00529 [Acorus calamus]
MEIISSIRMENNTPPTVRYNTKKVANRARGKRPSDPTKGHPGAEKFQTQPLYFEEELDILFGVTAARGDDSYVPTGSSSARGKRSFGGSDSTTVEDQDYEPQFTDSHPYSIPTPSSIPPTANVGDEATSPPRHSPLPPLPVAPKRQRTAVGQRLGSSIDRMCDILKMRTNLACGGNDTVPKFADAMALVDRIPEIVVDSPLYFYALDMLREPGNREVFCSFPTDARRQHKASQIDLDTNIGRDHGFQICNPKVRWKLGNGFKEALGQTFSDSAYGLTPGSS